MTETPTQACPLQWPAGWPRHTGQRDSDTRFRGPAYRWDRVVNGLKDELGRIGASPISVVISTNQPVRQDGMPYAQTRRIDDPGVAVYFWRRKRQMVMAQDRFDTILGNMRSLTMAIEGLRQMERHGGATMMERAFDGFLAIAPPDDCWTILRIAKSTVLGISTPSLQRDYITGAFRACARIAEGSGDDMDRIVKARDEAMRQIT